MSPAESDATDETDETELHQALRNLAEALETMLNLIKADALPTTPEAHRLMGKAITFLDESAERAFETEGPGEILRLATEVNKMVVSARERILDDAVATSPVPDHPDV
ncbi:hypothetical protein ITI46_04500 [Streptomyces oryzae]|uniref:Uncharacterized protein n=1 Tax=Streptomyces oryzae TaxID=1434886 RepID=A0ABS3X6K1_9ACTN|nr:hypothetical protein [Streptomyces oryzae]MBO8190959.1 hypothetical protein [Streptomyces oryzae]